MQKTIYDSYLGVIEYSEAYDNYEGKIKNKNGEIVEFNFNFDNNFEEVLKVTRQIIEQLESFSRKLKLYAADKLLDSYNNNWSQGEIIDREKFANRITIESVTIWNDCSAEIYYQDGDLFAGHSIVIYLDRKGRLAETNIAG